MNRISAIHSLEKRIRRHINGPEHDFFAGCAPGLEDFCRQELHLQKLSGSISDKGGGVVFSSRLPGCYSANLHSRTATRILMRITRFSASDFHMLSRKISEIPWELYLPACSRLMVHVTAHHSRLYHTDAIAARVRDGIAMHVPVRDDALADTRKTSGCGCSDSIQHVFVRAVDDRFTLSVDSSGQPLYKRGIKNWVGSAPIRENLAAAILIQAGYTGHEPLLDPMCGSGTFSLEAAMIAQNIPPGWLRSFGFEDWPGFRPRQLAHLRHQAEKDVVVQRKPIIFASDRSETVCSQLNQTLLAHDFLGCIQTDRADFFDIHPAEFGQTGLVVLNPPYGLRMGDITQSRELGQAVLKKLAMDFRGWKLALITPHDLLSKRYPVGLVRHSIVHGGLKLTLHTGII